MSDFILKEKNAQNWLILTVCLIHFLLGLDINIVSVSLPSVAEHFKINAGEVTRVVWVYFLVLTCFLLGFGKLGDLKGFRKMYLSGIGLFTIGSLLSALAFSFNSLIAFRIIQATGGALLFALTPAIISTYLPEEIRGRVFGINYSFTAFGGIVGRAASGFLISSFGWNSIFLINFPVGILALILGLKFLPKLQPESRTEKFDIAGSIIIFCVLFCALYVINTGQETGWFSGEIILFSLVSIIFLAVFIFRQMKIKNPLLNFSLMKNKEILFPLIAFSLVYIVTNGTIYIFPFFLQWIKSIPREEVGLLMAIPSVLQMVSGYISGRLSDTKNKKIICTTGLLLTIISFVFFVYLGPESGKLFIVSGLILYGIAIGVFIPSNTNNIMAQAPYGDKGSVSSVMVTVIRLGSALGVVLFGTVFSAYVPQKNPVQAGIPIDKIAEGFDITFLVGLVVCVITLLLFTAPIIFRKKDR